MKKIAPYFWLSKPHQKNRSNSIQRPFVKRLKVRRRVITFQWMKSRQDTVQEMAHPLITAKRCTGTGSAVMKAERFIPEIVDVPDSPLFSRTYNDMPLNTAQLAELQTRYPWELVSGRYREVTQTFRKIVLLRRMTDAEIEQALKINISYSQHSSIVANPDVPRKAMAYDLAIGQCHAFEYKKFWEGLLLQADWRRPENPDEYTRNYYQSGILDYGQIKQFMNKPERENGMPTGEQGVFNDYGSRIRPVGLSPYYVGYDDIPQWDTPEPLA